MRLVTLLSLANSAVALSIPKAEKLIEKRVTTTNVKLCNSFHEDPSSHCETHAVPIDIHACTKLSAASAGFVSSVELYNKAVKCTLWSTTTCTGSFVVLVYSGSKDLTTTKPPFDNKAKSVSCGSD
ncbi:hypothetical protein N0V93_006384 [Gnomoniopsis smithogilvyi]|uniref:Uncharacterized protein n=1 Tax=Gnomoniopsis smithogilvyi TaxID=1191159 RepID=A0A9W8YPK9_9PEZI|nr:hypothetical protein N0V93_006384 [Gnomoniopsis smithogilvyi]